MARCWSWTTAHALLAADIATPDPLLWAESFGPEAPGGVSIYVCRHLPGRTEVRYLLRARNAGTRGVYGPDLYEQIRATRHAASIAPIAYTNVHNLVAGPEQLQTLARLYPAGTAPAARRPPALPGTAPVIEFARPNDPHDARLSIRVARVAELDRTRYRRIDLFRPPARVY